MKKFLWFGIIWLAFCGNAIYHGDMFGWWYVLLYIVLLAVIYSYEKWWRK